MQVDFPLKSWGGIGAWTRENRGRDAGEERAGSGSSTFLKCSQISGVLNHSAIHGLGFFICCMNNMLHWQLLLSLWFQRLCMVYWQNNSFTCRNSFQGDRGVRTPYFPYFFLSLPAVRVTFLHFSSVPKCTSVLSRGNTRLRLFQGYIFRSPHRSQQEECCSGFVNPHQHISFCPSINSYHAP